MEPIRSSRTIDTRKGQGGGRLRAGVARQMSVAFSQEAFVHVTAVNPTIARGQNGNVQMLPDNNNWGKASILNFTSGQAPTNGSGPTPTPGGKVWFRSTHDVDLIVNVMAQ